MQFNLYLIKDYSKTQSVVISKVSHALADGVGACMVMAAL